MKSISKYYEQAELALAAYAVLSPGIGDEDNMVAYKNALQKAGMTKSQAERFSAKYSIVD
ncbi:MAG: hypothetical protein RBR45_07955 [Pseudomonas sp.]|jgi:hypothetical protein|nr:hypothetical protein [Pseudomonas sp.]